MISRLQDALAGDGKVIACWCGYADGLLTRHVANQGFDALVLDAQHGFHDEASLLNCIQQVAQVGKSPLVRLPLDRWDLVQRVLDFGALGVVAPMINNADDALRFAQSAKYPGIGSRSYAPRHAASLYGMSVEEYVLAANEQTLALAQIETREAYDNLDDILAIDGIDGILMGPSDFSIFVTGNPLPDQYGEGTIGLVEDIAKRTRAAGKIAAAFTLNPAHARKCHDFGYRLISVAMDSSLVQAGAADILSRTDF